MTPNAPAREDYLDVYNAVVRENNRKLAERRTRERQRQRAKEQLHKETVERWKYLVFRIFCTIFTAEIGAALTIILLRFTR